MGKLIHLYNVGDTFINVIGWWVAGV